MNNPFIIESRSLKVFLLRPLEAATVLACLFFLAKIVAGKSVAMLSWWILVLLIGIVPVAFALLFAAVYAVSWIISKIEQGYSD
jgi:hypothetical protein